VRWAAGCRSRRSTNEQSLSGRFGFVDASEMPLYTAEDYESDSCNTHAEMVSALKFSSQKIKPLEPKAIDLDQVWCSFVTGNFDTPFVC
jgi:hypothetical protein